MHTYINTNTFITSAMAV